MSAAAHADPADLWAAAMRRGDHDAAWSIADRILRRRDPTLRDDPNQPYHKRWVWDGTSPDHRHVLVRCYHGLGDTLQFARFLPALRARAAHITLEVQPELLPLLSTLPGPDRFLPFDLDAPSPASSCDIEIMELSHALRLPPEAAPPPYLHAPPLPALPGAVGLCWQSGDWDQDRSLPIDSLGPILAACRPLVSLHPTPAPPGFCNPAGCPADISATAGVVAGLDLVITVDSMIAHLAGALGRPCWLLLKHDADWRWTAGTSRSPWYPSMRLFRQAAPGGWAPVVAEVALRLAEQRAKEGKIGGDVPSPPNPPSFI